MDAINPQTIGSVPFKGFWIRVIAAILDVFVIIFFWLITFYLIFVVSKTGLLTDSNIFLSIVLAILTLIIVGIIYKPVMETSDYQGTFGKYLLGMKIVNQSGQKINLSASFIRTLVYFLTSIPFVNLLLLMIGFTEYKQGLHDIAAKTFVVSQHWEGTIPLEDNFGA
tara:strand:- start:1522 stop:2022 length:501 start_codon:yes stop_codon:yes gene_type:complete